MQNKNNCLTKNNSTEWRLWLNLTTGILTDKCLCFNKKFLNQTVLLCVAIGLNWNANKIQQLPPSLPLNKPPPPLQMYSSPQLQFSRKTLTAAQSFFSILLPAFTVLHTVPLPGKTLKPCRFEPRREREGHASCSLPFRSALSQALPALGTIAFSQDCFIQKLTMPQWKPLLIFNIF